MPSILARGVPAVALFCASLSTACSSSDDKTATNGPLDHGDSGAAAPDSGKAPVSAVVPPVLPKPTGTCPEFVEGMAAFSPAGGTEHARQAQIYIDPAAAAAKHGPLVIYWYGTGGQPSQAEQGLGTAGIQRIKDAGGVVVSPKHVNAGTFPWIQETTADVDFPFADEIIGCAVEKAGVDPLRIHSLGFSAGALFTAQLSYARSSYFASVATYSGGGADTFSDPNNKFAAMIVFGGVNDMLVLNFHDASIAYQKALTDAGHFNFLCDHGGGHQIPATATDSVVQFFFDHPYGTNPSPYAAGLPSTFPSYCTL